MPHTHQLSFDGDVVRKRFTSWSRGEAEREWLGLTVLHHQQPDLAPQPIERAEEDGAPVVVMSRVPGEPLGREELHDEHLAALATAHRRLFETPTPAGLPERFAGPSTRWDRTRRAVAVEPDLSPCRDPEQVALALAAARAWLRHDHSDLERVLHPVVGRGDGDLDNVMWDGQACRLVDWEEHGVSEVSYELADLVEHASSRLPRHVDPDAVVDRFALNRLQQRRLTGFRRLFAASWLVMLLPGRPGWTRNPEGSTEDQAAHLLDLLG